MSSDRDFAIEPDRAQSRHARSTDSPADVIRVGIVGLGQMGQQHARAISRLVTLARVAAVADPTPAARETMREVFPEVPTFASLEELLEAVDVDVIHVCSPPATHASVAAFALHSGRHVYIEKPVAESTVQAEHLLRLAEERRLLVCAGHQLLFEPPMREALELLPALGTLVHVESFFSFRPIHSAPGGRAVMSADAQLVDVLPHPVSLLLHILERARPAGAPELAALQRGEAGTVHAIVRRGSLSGTLVVTLEGRPIESYVRVVGTNGTVHADFVRSTVQRLIGPGSSGIDKALNPFRLARQLTLGTSGSLGKRVLRRQVSYPGLTAIFQQFYQSVRLGRPAPMAPESIIDTVRICERIATVVGERESPPTPRGTAAPVPGILITGGTGFLGRKVVEALAGDIRTVRAVARRLPAPWERVPGVEYVTADLASPVPPTLLKGVGVVIHCAAETAGAWNEHRRNSMATTEHILRAAADAGVRRLIHISSLATLASANDKTLLCDDSPLEPNPVEYGPYVWGKVESERLAEKLGAELRVDVRIIRPGALVDYDRFDPPGILGRRLGNFFIAVGKRSDQLSAVDVRFAAQTIAWVATNFAVAPRALNLISPVQPTRRALVDALRRNNPDVRVVWLPTFVLVPLSWLAMALQKILRPGRPAVNVANVFAQRWYDTSTISRIASSIPVSEGRPRVEAAADLASSGLAAASSGSSQ